MLVDNSSHSLQVAVRQGRLLHEDLPDVLPRRARFMREVDEVGRLPHHVEQQFRVENLGILDDDGLRGKCRCERTRWNGRRKEFN